MNIFVSNLSPSVNSADLKEVFSEYGEVTSANVIMDKYTGNSRGFAFVEMNDVEGQKAIDELNEAQYAGKTISVNVAKPRTERSSGGSYGFSNQKRNNSFGGNRRGY